MAVIAAIASKHLEDFRPGVYLHYKGKLYEADHLVRDANDDSRVGIHYIGLEVDGAREGPRHMIRTWQDWVAVVHHDGTVCENYKDDVCLNSGGHIMPRFRYLGPFYENWMLDEKS